MSDDRNPAAARAARWTGEDLRAWRQRLGWTQPRAAAELGLHEVSLSKLENGHRPIRGTVQRLAELLEAAAGGGVPTP